ncbi:unnamed protein product [Prunus armeniaca]
MSSPNTRSKGSSSSRSHANSTLLPRRIWMKMFSIFLRTHSFWVLIGSAMFMRKWHFYSKNFTNNTFDFCLGPMTPTLLGMAQIFGFRRHGRPVVVVGDYHRRKNQEKLAKPFTISPAIINHNCTSNYLKKFSTEKDGDQQHMLFLLYWLNRFNPLNLSAPGAFWMIQIWMQVYFPELRFSEVVLPEDQVLALPLMSAEVPKRWIEEYLMFFRHCTKRLFEKELEEEEARIEFRKKFLSVTLPRDLPFGGGKPPKYRLGAEVYHPNFYARQLGCPQLIPLKCSVNKINNSVDALYPSWEPNSCSSAEFDAWWKARFADLPASSFAPKVLFDGWDSWTVYAGAEAKQFMVQMMKDINAQVIEDPSMTKNLRGQAVQAGEVFGKRNKRKEATPTQDSATQSENSAESPPSPSRSKRLRKRAVVEYVVTEEPATAPTTTSGTDKELREAFEAVE